MKKHQSFLLQLTAVFSLLAYSPLAFAAYNQPVTWSDMSSLDLGRVLKSEYASPANLFEPTIPDSANELVLRDADNHISKEFHVPANLKENVTFWLKIYTQYTTQHLVLFDSKHPSMVYEVLDFRDLAKSAKTPVVYEIVRKQRIQKKIAAYRDAFRRLAKNPHLAHPNAEEANILREIARLPHKHTFAELSKSLHFQTGQRDNIAKGLIAAETFLPKMERLFADMDVPIELTRLSLVESSFDLSAESRVGASGIWQFLRQSGKEFLLIDDQHQIDERLSPLKATMAAGRLLKRNHGILNDWSLAITSYNHGIRGLPRSAKKMTSEQIYRIYDTCGNKHSHLGYASRNYYSEFLAVLHAEAYRKLYFGNAPHIPDHVPFTEFDQLAKADFAANIAKQRKISMQDFKLLNPDIRNFNRKIPGGFWIAVPALGDDMAGLTRHVRAKIIRRTSASVSGTSKSKS
jgi:membrane-bound lytic murein transglycosylase D